MVTGVLLAAGAGTRFGFPKVLAHDGAWLRAAVEALRGGGCDDVLVVVGASEATGDVTGAADPVTPDGARRVPAVDWEQGMSASLRAGLDAADATARFAVIMVVDTPDVGADVVARVLAAAVESPSGLARAVYEGKPGHPVVLTQRHWAAAVARAVGDEGARQFLRERDDVVAVECSDLASGIDHDYPH